MNSSFKRRSPRDDVLLVASVGIIYFWFFSSLGPWLAVILSTVSMIFGALRRRPPAALLKYRKHLGWCSWILLTAGLLTATANFPGLSGGSASSVWLVGLSLAVCFVAVFLYLIKKNVIDQMRNENTSLPAQFDDYPDYNAGVFSETTAYLIGHGFVPSGDFARETRLVILTRLFVHPDHHCLGIISQPLQKTQSAVSPNFSVNSYFKCASLVHLANAAASARSPIATPDAPVPTDRDAWKAWDGYTLTTGNQGADWTNGIFRYDRCLSNYLNSGNIDQVIAAHLEHRQIVAKKICATWDTEELVETFHATGRQLRLGLLHRVRRRPMAWLLAQAWLTRKQMVYWGNLKS